MYQILSSARLLATWMAGVSVLVVARQAAGEIVITEAGTGVDDFVEIQNVSATAVDTSGWVVALNDAELEEVNDVNPTLWPLPDMMAAGELLYRHDDPSDPAHYWGQDIFWRTSGPGWVMIVDDVGNVADFVVWGYNQADIASLSVNVNGFDVIAKDAWEGPAVPAEGGSDRSLQRSGNFDHDDASDWALVEPVSMGTMNQSLSTPFIPEPSTFVLLATGGLGLAACVWRRRALRTG